MGLRVINFSNYAFKKLVLLQIPDEVTATEAKLYIYKEKDKKKVEHKKLLKIYYRDTLDYLNSKLDILTKLIEYHDVLNIPELVLPDEIVTVDRMIKGIKMPFIANNVNMALLLDNPKVSVKQKIKYLKEILAILIKVSNIYELQDNFFLGDIQSSNFILDVNDQMIKAIDLDSSYFNGLTPFPSRYLAGNILANAFDKKYPRDSKTGLILPSKETTYLQFAYMMLNSLTGLPCHRYGEKNFYNTLAELNHLGLDVNIMGFFESLFSRTNTVELQPEDLDRINYSKSYYLSK
jgi:hypothetical protein